MVNTTFLWTNFPLIYINSMIQVIEREVRHGGADYAERYHKKCY